MAPRGGRGGGGGSSGDGLSSCPDAFLTPTEQASFALDVVLFAIYLGIFIALCVFRKKNVAGKKLLGLPFIGAVFFFALTNACSIIATALEQCEVILITTYFDWHAAIAVFTYVSYWLLFVVVVFTLNIMLRQQLSDSTTIFKTILLVATGVIGLLTCVLAGLTAYVNYASPRASRSWLGSDILTWSTAVANLRAAYFSLYLVSILASGGLALATILSLRRERKAAGDLIGWIIALTVAMVLWIIIAIIYIAWYLENHDYTLETSLALAYIMGLAQALSCIFILCIAKHVCWRTPSNTDTSVYAPVAYQPQYAYNGNPNHQTYQYDQAPEYAGTGNPIKA